MYIPCRNLYASTNTADFEAEIANFIITFTGSAADTREKLSTMLGNIDAESFNLYLANRQAIDQTNNIIKYAKFIQYLQILAFYAQTEHPNYKISVHKKQKITNFVNYLITDPPCEPGIETHFNTLISEISNATDWVTNNLEKQRRLVIDKLAEQFWQENSFFPEGLRIHVNKFFITMAASFNLGFEDTLIDDAYLNHERKEKMRQFFTKNYKKAFQKYEKECFDGLFTHIYSEFMESVVKANLPRNINEYQPSPRFPLLSKLKNFIFQSYSSNARQSEPTNNEDPYESLNTFFTLYFDKNNINYYDFLEVYTDNVYKLKNEEELKQNLKKILVDMLFAKEVLIPFERYDDKETTLPGILSPITDIKLEIFLIIKRIKDGVFDCNFTDISLLKIKENIEVLAYFISKNPHMWDSLPHAILKDHHFLKTLIDCLPDNDNYLAQQIVNIQPAYIRFLSDRGLTITYYESLIRDINYYRKNSWRISPIYLQENLPAGISKYACDRFIELLRDEIQDEYIYNWNDKERLARDIECADDDLLVDCAFNEHNLLKKALYEHNNWVEALCYFQQNLLINDLQFNNLSSLSNQVTLNARIAYELMQNIPSFLLSLFTNIIKSYRSVIFFGINCFLLFLVYFQLIINPVLPMAFLMVCFHINIFLLMAFTSAYAYMLWHDIQENYYAKNLRYLILILLPCCNASLLIPTYTTGLILYPVIILIHSLITFVLRIIINKVYNRLTYLDEFVLGLKVFWLEVIYSPLNIILFLACLAVNFIYYTLNIINLSRNICYSMLSRSAFNISAYFYPKEDFNTVASQITNGFLALQLSSQPSANQKGIILENIWQQAHDDILKNHLKLNEVMHKPYTFEFQRKEYTMSYVEVAARRRVNNTEFSLVGKQGFSLFATSTTKNLPRLNYDSSI